MKKIILLTSAALSFSMASKSWAELNPNCNCPNGTCYCACDNGTNCCTCYVKQSSCGDNCNWSIDNGVLNISGSGDMYNSYWDYVVEGSAEHPDVWIGQPWYGENFTSVVINGVSSVGISTFDTNQNITSVVIGESVERIEDCAFCYAGNIESVTFAPNSKLTSIGADAFSNMKLTNITLPDSLKRIGEAAFYYNEDLTSITIPDTINLEGQPFYNTNITEVTCINTKGQCEALQSLLSSQGINATFNTIMPQPTSCPAGSLEKNGSCIPAAQGCGENWRQMETWCNRIRYTPAEAAQYLKDTDNEIIMTFKVNR